MNTLISILFIFGSITSLNCWDIAVTSDDDSGVQFFNRDGTKEWQFAEILRITALYYEPLVDVLFMVKDTRSIYALDMKTRKYVELVESGEGQINDLTFDPVSQKVFWTDQVKSNSTKSKISWKSVSDNSRGYLVEMLEKPFGIAVDSCRGHVYWSKEHQGYSIVERSNLDGSNITEIHKETPTDGHIIYGLFINQINQQLYWAHDLYGIHYSIETYDLNTGNISDVYRSTDQAPLSIAVDSLNTIYWTDTSQKNILTLLAENQTKLDLKINASRVTAKSYRHVPKSNCLFKYVRGNTNVESLFRNASKEDSGNVLDCLYGSVENGVCRCYKGYGGEKCEISLCNNYCFNGAMCVYTGNAPKCVNCTLGYEGERCEVFKCYNHCLRGSCSIDVSGDPICRCNEGFAGDRCENNTTLVNLLEATLSGNTEVTEEPYWMYATAALASMSGILTLILVALSVKYLRLRRRPTIKKRIIVNRNVTPLTARPEQPQHCEITIENCCNMNICETPCFEPRSMRASSKEKQYKEEKCNLITNMELPEDI